MVTTCWLTVYRFQYFILAISALDSSISNVFQNPDAQSFQPFQHMVVERQLYTGRVYIGGVNHLYQLSPELDLQARVETGPLMDSVDCPASRASPCDAKKVMTQNYNKALAIFAKQSKLIACGSLYQGSCRLHKLYNISDADQPIAEAVVANDQVSSSVIFVAPGPPILQGALYVGSTYPNQGKFNDELPAVATRSLDPESFLNVAHRTINSETQMFVENTLRKQYRIEYVFGFSSGNYSYFATRQPRYTNFGSVYHSKLARLCHGDLHYYSYAEVPLECVDENDEYNLIQSAYLGKPGFDLARDLNVSVDDDVLYAVFAKTADMGTKRASPTRQSALCIYTMKQIEEKFMDNIHLCANGSMLRGLSYFKQEKPCAKASYVSDILACGYEVNYPLGGNMPIRRRAGYTTNSVRLTAVAATTTHMHTVVFMGTDDGNLKKAVVEKAEEVFEYETVAVDPGRPILADMLFDMSGEYIYVLTAAAVSKVKVQECDSKYPKCNQCLGAKDPFCGWCSDAYKCITQGSCNRQHWLPYKDTQCTIITRVTPDKLQVKTAAFLVLEIQNLPYIPKAGQLSCVFQINGRKSVTGASRNDNSSRCAAPETHLRHIPAGQHATIASLSVHVDSGPEFASTNFTFYDCSIYNSCQDCVSTEYPPCDWCAETVTCISNAEDSCRNQTIINGLTRPGPSIRKGPSFCPRILPVDSSPIFYVPSGTVTKLSVKVMNLLDFQTSFECLLDIGEHVVKMRGKRVEDRIECDPMYFADFDRIPNATATAKFSVVWDQGKTLDNVENIRVFMYKCEKLASNCGLCLSLDTQFACGWCEDTQSCMTEGLWMEPDCKTGPWINKSEICPGPKILNFYPQSGPLEGGTNLTIEGINLGRYFRDIENAVQINNITCVPITKEYQPSIKINAQQVQPTTHNQDQSWTQRSVDLRQQKVRNLVAPSLPFRAIIYAGSSVQVIVAGVLCEVTRREKDRVYCRSGASSVIKSGSVVMTIDAATRIYLDKQYSYMRDPNITSITPKRSIVSGGIRMRVDGEQLQLIQIASLYFIYMGQEFSVQCDVVRDMSPDETDEATDIRWAAVTTSTYIRCRTPKIHIATSDRLYPERNRPLLVDYGFVFDGVSISGGRQKNANTMPDGGFLVNENKFSIYPDPTFSAFGKSGNASVKPVKFLRGDFLPIEGKNLDLAAAKEDVEVYIGDRPCIVRYLKGDELVCKPPSEQPARPTMSDQRSSSLSIPGWVGGFSSDGVPEVSVRVGGANYTLGYLIYDDSYANGAGGLPVGTLVAVGIAAVTLSILLAISVWWCMKRRSVKTALKRLEQELASYQEAIPPNTSRSLNDQVDILSYNKAYETDRSLVILSSNLLGAGQFGKIVQAVLRTADGRSGMQLAVKMVRDSTDVHSTRALADELKVMSHIRPHVNVLCLVGACTRDLERHGLLVLTEFCENGSLRDYLIRNASIFNGLYANAIDQGPIEKLLHYAFQAANGMVHLSASNVIHRDLALRNLLLTGKHIVKIGDFGLSRQHIGSYQMSPTSSTPLPIYWMALESLSTGLYTKKSDVWSFGIVLWEIFSCGKLPYTKHTGGPAVFRDWLHESDDNRLGPPSIACDEMYQLMQCCWLKNPNDRPDFSECKSVISNYLRQKSPNSYHLLELLISEGWMTVAENQAPPQHEDSPETERLLNPPGQNSRQDDQGSDAIHMEFFDLNAEVDSNGYQLPTSKKRIESDNPQHGCP